MITAQSHPFAQEVAQTIISQGSEVLWGDALFDKKEALQTAVKRASIVIHLSGLELNDSMEDIQNFLLKSSALIKLCSSLQTPLLIGNTDRVYGGNPTVLQEDSPTVFYSGDSCGPGQRLVEEYAQNCTSLPYGIARYIGLYGDRGGEKLDPILHAIAAKEPLPLPGTFSDILSLCHFHDAVRATLAFAERLMDGRCLREIINIGNANSYRLDEIISILSSLLGYPLQGNPAPRSHGIPDLSKMNHLLKVKAEIPLEQGLAALLQTEQKEGSEPKHHLPMIRPKVMQNMELLLRFGRIIQSGWLSNYGPENHALEQEMASFLQAQYCLSCTSGSVSLLLALWSLELKGKKAILPSFTYVATLNAVVAAGMEAVFCDINSDSWTMDPNHLAQLLKIHDDVGLVIPVNIFGVPPDLDHIIPLARSAQAYIVYDNAHGLGSTTDGHTMDPRPDLTIFSLHATKVLPAAEGGLLVARDEAVYQSCKRRRNHGLLKGELHWSCGLNGKMDELRAALVRHQLKQLPEILQRRRDAGIWLREQLGGIRGLALQKIAPNINSNFQNFGIRFAMASEQDLLRIQNGLVQSGVGANRYFYPLLHQLVGIQSTGNVPNSEHLIQQHLCLPLYSGMRLTALKQIKNALLQQLRMLS